MPRAQLKPATPPSPALMAAAEFFRAAGLDVAWSPGAKGFISGVAIERGRLLLDPGCDVSDALHEAGHLACVPARFRSLLSGDLEEGYERMFRQLRQLNLEPDSALMRACIQCSDPEATAWAWAAGLQIGLAPEEIILDAQYQGTGAALRFDLQHRCFSGIHGLAHAGFCRTSFVGTLPKYPALAFWTQPA